MSHSYRRISTTGNVSDERKHATEHVNHCVTWIQQSLMCASDTSVIVYVSFLSLFEVADVHVICCVAGSGRIISTRAS